MWTPKPPAGDVEINALQEAAPFSLPTKYVELLRFCNGGYGDLNCAPLLLEMDSIAQSVDTNAMWRIQGQFLDFWFIGGNGGMESIGLTCDTANPTHW